MLEMSNKHLFLSIIIPVYNEEPGLPALFEELDRLKQVNLKEWGELEIILVNDGSTDNSWDLIAMKCETDSDYIGINLSRNFGHQNALMAGIETARGKVAVTLDADLQDPPSLIPEMVKLHLKGYDVVHGTRRNRGRESRIKAITARLFYFLIRSISEVDVISNTGDFRLLSRRVITHLAMLRETHRFIRGLVPWVGFPQTQIVYDRDDRIAGSTHYSFRKMIMLAFDGIASMSVIPLRIAYMLSLILFAIFFAYIMYTLYKYFILGIPLIPGWTSLMSAITIFGTIQMILFGIFGEYIGRIYEQTKERPLYIISEIMRKNPLDSE
jgi:dolichol-phosphate mannosyltransferase